MADFQAFGKQAVEIEELMIEAMGGARAEPKFFSMLVSIPRTSLALDDLSREIIFMTWDSVMFVNVRDNVAYKAGCSLFCLTAKFFEISATESIK